MLGDAAVPGSLVDTAVRAAAAIAEHYLQGGDRVGLLEFGQSGRRLRAAGGRRHFMAVLEWLLDVRADLAVPESDRRVSVRQHIAPNTLVVVLTPLVDPRSAEMLATLARSGRFVVAIDVFPPGALAAAAAPPRGGPWTAPAAGLWLLERENVLGRLREHGIPVVTWGGAGSLDLVLRDVARMAAAPRGR